MSNLVESTGEAVESTSEVVQASIGSTNQRHIHFVDDISGDDLVLMSFQNPSQRYAVLAESAGTASGDVLEVTFLPPPTTPQATANHSSWEWMDMADNQSVPPPIHIKVRGIELMWRPGRSVLQCDSQNVEALLSALVEFAHYECELRRIEEEIAGSWTELELDKSLAFEVTTSDLQRSLAVGSRMNRVLQRRIRLARIEPTLYQPGTSLTQMGQKLGEELREKARIESRLETVDAQLEVFESVYEMCGQRMGEHRAARQEHVLEWIIIVLLTAEMLLLLAQTVWKSGV